MKICPKCNTYRQNDNARFCKKCGAEMVDAAVYEEQIEGERKEKNKLRSKLYLQIIFTLLSLCIIGLAAYYPLCGMVNKYLLHNSKLFTESVLAKIESEIESDMKEPKATLDNFLLAARDMISKDADVKSFQEFIGETKYKRYKIYGYFKIKNEWTFIHNRGRKLPKGYEIREKEWNVVDPWDFKHLQRGIQEGNVLYNDPFTNELGFAYSSYIKDDKDNLLGFACIGVPFDFGRYVIQKAREKAGHGVLVDKRLRVIALENSDFNGSYIYDPAIPLRIFRDKLEAREDVVEGDLEKTYETMPAVVFFKKLPNDWYIGLVAAKDPYYNILRWGIIGLGTLCATILIGILIRRTVLKLRRYERHETKSPEIIPKLSYNKKIIITAMCVAFGIVLMLPSSIILSLPIPILLLGLTVAVALTSVSKLSYKKSIITVICVMCAVFGAALLLPRLGIDNGILRLILPLPILLCGLICGWRFGFLCGMGVCFCSFLFYPLFDIYIYGGLAVYMTLIKMMQFAAYGIISAIVLEKAQTGKIYADLYISVFAALIVGFTLDCIIVYLITDAYMIGMTWMIWSIVILGLLVPNIIVAIVALQSTNKKIIITKIITAMCVAFGVALLLSLFLLLPMLPILLCGLAVVAALASISKLSYIKKSIITAMCVAFGVARLPPYGILRLVLPLSILVCGLICGWHFGLLLKQITQSIKSWRQRLSKKVKFILTGSLVVVLGFGALYAWYASGEQERIAKSEQLSGLGDVYVAGIENGVATLWKNGVAQRLSDGMSVANSVYVSGKDVYVAGYEHNAQGNNVATLWKNGLAQNIDDGSYMAKANSVFVSGDDVYVASSGGLWKNGVPQRLSDSHNNEARSVFVSGSDVYVVSSGGLWKNGVIQRLNGWKANSVFVSGEDVYVVGQGYNSDAALWKNGVAQRLGDGVANSVFVSGSDVYVAGHGTKPYHSNPAGAILWKNGIAQRLSSDNTSAAHSVFVVGNAKANPNANASALKPSPPPVLGDIYAAGVESNSQAQGKPTAMVWKNGNVHWRFSDWNGAEANSIFISGNDVYAAGYERNAQGNTVATVWKNSNVHWRHDYASTAHAIFVSGNNVYVAGEQGAIATVWKNGSVHWRLNDGIYEAVAGSIFVSGNDVYVAGRESNANKKWVATVWKNGGVHWRISDGYSDAYAHAIFVSDNDVYVAKRESGGMGKFIATVMKNGGARWQLNDGYSDVRAYSIFVSGNDVYAAGVEINAQDKAIATVWKNGNVHWRLGDGYNDTRAYSIFASGSDVYVAGNEVNAQGKAVATIWKNGGVHWRHSDGYNDTNVWSVFIKYSQPT